MYVRTNKNNKREYSDGERMQVRSDFTNMTGYLRLANLELILNRRLQ